jgi:hypothetical protein
VGAAAGRYRPVAEEASLRRIGAVTVTVVLSAAAVSAQQAAPPSAPLAVHIGDSDFLIGGFMDMTSITRSTNTGNGIGTSFGTIPFGNVPAGNLSETKFSAQNSRVSLQITSKVGEASLKGYLETDFLGNAPNGLNVTSNSNTLRMRLYWVQFTAGKFEFLAGQSWSMMTPGRSSISPMPGDLFYTQDVDTNYQMGLTWGRTPGFRFIAHATDRITAGLALENPEQYVGSAVVLPAAFPPAEVDAGTVTTNVPNPYPDIIGKIAFDIPGASTGAKPGVVIVEQTPKPSSGLHQHIEAAVLIRGYKTFNQPTGSSFSATAIGGSINAVIQPVKALRVIGTTFFSNGGGRYIANTNIPDFIVNPDASLSLVKTRSFIVGAEVQAAPKSIVYAYYSQAHADQNVTVDTKGQPIGFGILGSAASNKKVEETTAGLTQTLFRDPKVGGMQLMVQYSYVKRTPFSVPAGTAADAHLSMVYVNVRYLLP